MSESSGIRIKVKTEELQLVANEVEEQIKRLKQKLETVDDVVKRSSAYWEGEGQSAYIQTYHKKSESVENTLKAFSDHIANLRIMAGVYEAAEESAVETVNALSSDVIV